MFTSSDAMHTFKSLRTLKDREDQANVWLGMLPGQSLTVEKEIGTIYSST